MTRTLFLIDWNWWYMLILLITLREYINRRGGYGVDPVTGLGLSHNGRTWCYWSDGSKFGLGCHDRRQSVCPDRALSPWMWKCHGSGRELMLSGWNSTQSTNAGGSIHYYDFCEIDILTLNQTLCHVQVTWLAKTFVVFVLSKNYFNAIVTRNFKSRSAVWSTDKKLCIKCVPSTVDEFLSCTI